MSRENAVVIRPGLFFGAFLTRVSPVVPVVDCLKLFFFAAAFLGATFFFADFLAADRFRTNFFAGLDVLPAIFFFELIDFFLFFFLAAIRAV